MPEFRYQITSWLNVKEKKTYKTKYGFLTNSQWLLKERERFKKINIVTKIRINPDDENEQGLFFLSVDDIPHIETPQERYSSIKNTYK